MLKEINEKNRKRRYILTGAPGSGKTTMIDSLAQLNYVVVHEAATEIIRKEQNLGHSEPWNSPDFIDKIVSLQKKRQLEADNIFSELQIYDRSPICTYALALYLGFSPSKALKQEIERIKKENIYEKYVFFVENIGFIENTDARKISFEDALKFEQVHLECYAQFGYECIKVPPLNRTDRIEYLNEIIQRLLAQEETEMGITH